MLAGLGGLKGDLEDRSIAMGAAGGGCAVEVSLRIHDQIVRVRSVRAVTGAEAVEDFLFAARGDFVHNAVPIQAALLCCPIEISLRIANQCRYGLDAIMLHVYAYLKP